MCSRGTGRPVVGRGTPAPRATTRVGGRESCAPEASHRAPGSWAALLGLPVLTGVTTRSTSALRSRGVTVVAENAAPSAASIQAGNVRREAALVLMAALRSGTPVELAFTLKLRRMFRCRDGA